MLPVGLIIGVMLTLAAMTTGWGTDVLPSAVQRAERLCATNGGWAAVNPLSGNVTCANNARFGEDVK